MFGGLMLKGGVYLMPGKDNKKNESIHKQDSHKGGARKASIYKGGNNSKRNKYIIVTLVVILAVVWGGVMYALSPNFMASGDETSKEAQMAKENEEMRDRIDNLQARNRELKEEITLLEEKLSLANQPDEEEIFIFKDLVKVRDIDSTILVDLRYAGENNFTEQQLYPFELCLLRKSTAEKLAAVQAEVKEDGYRLKVWDAYRPLGVQEKLWEVVSDPIYVADPAVGSNHNRGAAVDVTLVDEKGEKLIMPTGFDDFSEQASRNYPNMPEEAEKNMNYLTDVMVRNGFTPIQSEWWHYNDEDIQEYDLLDVSFEEFVEEYFSR